MDKFIKHHASIPILVIDDDQNFLTFILLLLENFGFTNVFSALTGKKGLDILQLEMKSPASETSETEEINMAYYNSSETLQELNDSKFYRVFNTKEPFIVLLDVMLPDANGFDICKLIKDKYKNAIVITLSGLDLDHLQETFLASGADDFIAKPFKNNELLARIELHVSKYIHAEQLEKFRNNSLITNHVPHIGDVIDNFLITDTLGWGKSSIIYKVIDTEINEIFAVKLLTRYSLEFPEVLKRFNEEIRVISMFNHPNIAKLHTTGEYRQCPYIAMEYIPGNNLEEEQAVNGIPPVKNIYTVARQLCAAIGELHSKQIVHRDIKPKNIMLMPQENLVKLTDFGIAKRLNESVANLTKDGLIVGTPIYMAPELFIGEEPSIASDIYSFGVTIYQYATGSPPFSAPNNWELAKKHTHDTPRSLCTLNPELHPAFNEFIIDYCLAKDPRERPASMEEVDSILKELEPLNLNQ